MSNLTVGKCFLFFMKPPTDKEQIREEKQRQLEQSDKRKKQPSNRKVKVTDKRCKKGL